MDRIDTLIIGAGVVGLATARACAFKGHDVAILEAEDRIGSITSSRNSEVIHAGLYYPKGSLKARLCVRGRNQLYAYAAEKAIPHKFIGKLIVARNAAERAMLDHILTAAHDAGVYDLERLSAEDLNRREGALAGVAGLFSPSTGIIDVHAYMDALLMDAQAHGAMLALKNRVTSITPGDGGFMVGVMGEDGPYEISARRVVNAAGLSAWDVARMVAGLRDQAIPPRFYAKGCYFRLNGPSPFSHLIYPVPVPGGLGIHLTLDMQGGARFGPNVVWTDTVDYKVDSHQEAAFRDAIEGYYPGIRDRSLTPDFAGVRPKISGPGRPGADFMIQTEQAHGVPGLIQLFGIESPGLTASMALADHVVTLLSAPAT